jgi:hypothetical protein
MLSSTENPETVIASEAWRSISAPRKRWQKMDRNVAALLARTKQIAGNSTESSIDNACRFQ